MPKRNDPDLESVRFLTDHTVDDEHKGTSKETSYKAGKVYQLPPDSVRHFVTRGKAEPTAEACCVAGAEAKAQAEDDAAKASAVQAGADAKAAEDAAKASAQGDGASAAADPNAPQGVMKLPSGAAGAPAI